MLAERSALRTVNVPPNDGVPHLVDKAQVLRVGIAVLGKDKLVHTLEGSPTKGSAGFAKIVALPSR